MKLTKKRKRYKENAIQIALDNNLPLPQSWKDIWSLIETYSEPEYVYFIGSYDLPNRVKIGKSINPYQRLKALQTSMPLPLTMYGAYSFLEESEVHSKFKHLRVSGEWFEYTSEIKEYLETIALKDSR